MPKKDKFITVMAVLDDETQELLQSIQYDLEQQYGVDTKTKNIPFHITLGSYAVEATTEIVSRIIEVANQTQSFDIEFGGFNHFNNMVRFIKPQINEELLRLHSYFDSDFANGYDDWIPHVTIYRHSEPMIILLSEKTVEKIERLKSARIVGIELGEFFPPKKIIRIIFEQL